MKIIYFLIGFIIGLVLFTDSRAAHGDNSHNTLELPGITIDIMSGSEGYNVFERSNDGDDNAVDARLATFIVANSTHAEPWAGPANEIPGGCNDSAGTEPVNRYPIKLYYDERTHFVGGLVYSDISQTSDWEDQYCNSATILFRGAPDSIVDGVRFTGGWDPIRPSQNTTNLTVKDNWFSDIRDDVVENDEHESMLFDDNLVDGTFQGISVRGGQSSQSTNIVEIRRSKIRIRDYLYKGTQYYGALFKNESTSPKSIITETVVAVEPGDGITWSSNWPRVWSKIESCSDNKFLWISDDPIHNNIDPDNIPACFEVIVGEVAAGAVWAEAKQDWIDCHPKLARLPSDPPSNPNNCSLGGCH